MRRARCGSTVVLEILCDGMHGPGETYMFYNYGRVVSGSFTQQGTHALKNALLTLATLFGAKGYGNGSMDGSTTAHIKCTTAKSAASPSGRSFVEGMTCLCASRFERPGLWGKVWKEGCERTKSGLLHFLSVTFCSGHC